MESSNILLTLCLSIVVIASVKGKKFPQCDSVASKTFVSSPLGCQAYIYCDGDNSFDDVCPVGMNFNIDDGSCDLESNVVCHTETDSPSTIAPSTIVPAAAASPKDMCVKQFSGYFAYPNNCHYYYRCTNGFLTVQECAVGFGWDSSKSMCTADGCSS